MAELEHIANNFHCDMFTPSSLIVVEFNRRFVDADGRSKEKMEKKYVCVGVDWRMEKGREETIRIERCAYPQCLFGGK